MKSICLYVYAYTIFNAVQMNLELEDDFFQTFFRNFNQWKKIYLKSYLTFRDIAVLLFQTNTTYFLK